MAVLYGRIGGAWVPISSSMDNEVVIGPDDPIASYPTAELWYDTDAVALPITGFVPTAGGTMTGQLGFGSRTGELISLYDPGYILGMQSGGAYIRSPSGQFAIYRGGVHSDTALDPGAGGAAPFQITAGIVMMGWNGGSASPLRLIGGSLGNCYMSLYAENDSTGPGVVGTRSGYVGFPNNVNLYISNDRSNGGITLFAPAGTGAIILVTNGTESARLDPSGTLLVGKNVSNLATNGVEVLGNGRIYSTTDTGVNVNGVFNINAAVVGNTFASYRRSNTQIGSVTCATTTTVAYNTSSDRRLKRIIGPVADAAERVRQLRVWHFAWKADDTEQDGLIADEVQSVVPIAVTGEPDAVDEDGNIEAQQMDYSKLVPLLTAALQEALDRIDTLEQRIDVLEAA
jgi:hypothetical protein